MNLRLFHASWCGPCKTLIEGGEPPLGVSLEMIDIDAQPEEATRMAIKAIPTLVAVSDSGEVRGMMVGPANWGKVEEWLTTLA